MKYFNKIIDSLNEFVTNNSEFIENWNNFLGVLASLFAIFGIFLAIMEYFKNYHPNIKTKTKVGTVCIAKDFAYFFAIVVKVKNNSTFKINTEDVFIEVWPRRAICLKELESLPEHIKYVKTEKKSQRKRKKKAIINSPNIVEHNHIIEERSSKMFYLELNEELIKYFLANKNLSFFNLRKRIYVRVETANRTYRIFTPYTIRKLIKIEQEYQSKRGTYNLFDFII